MTILRDTAVDAGGRPAVIRPRGIPARDAGCPGDADARRLARAIALGGLALGVAALCFFSLWPRTDIVVSGWMAGPAGDFPLRLDPLAKAARWLFRMGSDGIAAAALALAILGALGLAPGGRLRRIAAWASRGSWFVALAYLLGPGLMVNRGLKAHWGRARPREIAEFGGDALFTPPWLPTDQCARNCSFVSGEASALACVAIALLLLYWPRASPRGRVAAAAGAALWVAAGSGLRMAFGGHFLSDVLLAIALMAVMVPCLYLLSGPGVSPVTPARVENRR